jgi:hypothetical protein
MAIMPHSSCFSAAARVPKENETIRYSGSGYLKNILVDEDKLYLHKLARGNSVHQTDSH